MTLSYLIHDALDKNYSMEQAATDRERRRCQPGAERGRYGVALQEVPAGAVPFGPR